MAQYLVDFKTLEKKVVAIMQEKEFENIKIYLEDGAKCGDGFCGIIVRALIKGYKKGVEHEMDVILKCAPTKPELRRNMNITQSFRREKIYYQYIVPIYVKIQEEFNLAEEDKYRFPECHAIHDDYCNEFIMLDNLNASGYSLMKLKRLDYRHAKLALIEVSKLHALSIVYENKMPEDFKVKSSQLDDVLFTNSNDFNVSGLSNYMDLSLKKFINCLLLEEHKERVMKVVGPNYLNTVKDLYGRGKYNIINHGDYWLNNILFKYTNDEPISVLPLDYQIAKYASVANDVIYLLSLIFDGELWRNHFWELIELYYSSLSKRLDKYGLDVKDFCTYDEFVQELRDRSTLGLFINMILLPFFTSDHALDMHKIYDRQIPKHFYDNTEEFVKRANDVVTHFVNFGFI